MSLPSSAARILRFRHGVSAFAKVHVGVTLVSLGYGAFGHKFTRSNPLLNITEETFDSGHYQYLAEFVENMYSGKGMTHDYCKLDNDATFEDPAAVCQGNEEINEAFRALSKINPKPLSKPRCVDVSPMGSTIACTYCLHQQYGTMLTVRSLLVVHIQLQTVHTKGFPESQFLVKKLEEQWNGTPLIDNYLFWIPRRING